MVRRRNDQRLNRRVPRGSSPAARTERASEPDSEDNPHAEIPGHPRARGTLPMARKLIDPTIENEIQALAAEAPLPLLIKPFGSPGSCG
jgi:hypothetical protein